MEYLKLKDMKLSQLVLGTDGYCEKIEKKTAFEIMEVYVENGGNVFDTARMYSDGKSEECVGEFVRNFRDDIYISTKCAFPPKEDMHRSRLSKEEIEADIDESLRTLKIDCIDLLWLHRDDEKLSVEPIIDTLNTLATKGKIRYFGASNWSHDRITMANRYAADTGQTGFCASQVLYNMASRAYVWDDTIISLDGEEKQKYDKSGFPVFAFSAQAKGFFEKYAVGNLSAKAKERFLCEKSVETFHAIKKRADESGDTISCTALKMLSEQSAFDVFPIIGPSNANQLKDTLNL